MRKICLVSNILIISVLAVASLLFTNSAKAAAPIMAGDLVCKAPVAVNSNRLGYIDLDWTNVNNATGFTISILPPGGVCGVTAPLKTLPHVNGTPAWYSTAAMLCGLPICIQVDCCNDRCDQCQIPQDDQYCQNINPGCACKDGKIFDNDYGLKYKCFQPDGSIKVQKERCAAGTDAGCSWQCNYGVVDNRHDVCGKDYEVKCGEGPHTRIVGQSPYEFLCSVEGALNVDTDKYLINPPGVYALPLVGEKANSLLDSRLFYKWQCLGAKADDYCYSCQRAMCPNEFQDKAVTADFVSTSPDRLCPDGTATKPVLNTVTKRWEWDCNGNHKCKEDGKENKNFILQASSPKADKYDQVDHCSAQQAGCGWADAQQVTYDTWHKNGGLDIAYVAGGGPATNEFWCQNGGRVQAVTAPTAKNTISIGTNSIHNVNGLADTLNWQCVYDDLAKPITCNAGLVSCNQTIANKNLSQTSFNSFKQAKGFTYNLCLLGGSWLGVGNQDRMLFLNRFTRIPAPGLAVDGKFKWTCEDDFGGVDKCEANETSCKKPPHQGFEKSKNSLLQKIMCNNGEVVELKPTSDIGGREVFWTWSCKDDFKDTSTECLTYHLTCPFPDIDRVYDDWDSFGKDDVGFFSDVKCGARTTSGDLEKATCSGICTNEDPVEVTLNTKTKQWNWTCGEDVCKAKISDCSAPPAASTFVDMSTFKASLGKTKDGASKCVDNDDGSANCCGVCTDQGDNCNPNNIAQAVRVTLLNGKFNWNCGSIKAKTCEAFTDSCGTADKSKHTDDYFGEQSNVDKSFLCKNGTKVKPRLEAGVWKWVCGIENCSATEVACSTLSGKNYTAENWTSKNLTGLCAGGVLARNEAGVMQDINKFIALFTKTKDLQLTTDDYEQLLSGRQWYCAGDGAEKTGVPTKDTVVCTNNIVDCGAADASRYVKDELRIKPKTLDGMYHASFDHDAGVPSEMRCLNANFKEIASPDNSLRGAFTWNCLDSDYNLDKAENDAQNKLSATKCVARKDCGWAGSEQTGYATVYFDESTRNPQAAGCWTAENIISPWTKSIDMTWHEAVNRSLDQMHADGYDGFNHGAQAQARINQTGPEQGICPDGWEVPSSGAWHNLEYALYDKKNGNAKCDESRFTTSFDAASQCDLAATAESKLGYGLNSPITFDGLTEDLFYKDLPDRSYWTKTTACSNNSSRPNYNIGSDGVDYCPPVTKTQDIQCRGTFLKAGSGTRYFNGAPFAYYFDENPDRQGKIARVGVNEYNLDPKYSDKQWCNDDSDSSTAWAGALLRCVRTVTKASDSKCDAAGDQATWQQFYDTYFKGYGYKLNVQKIPYTDPNRPELNFLQFMPAGLTYNIMHAVEKDVYYNKVESPLKNPYRPVQKVKDYDGEWDFYIDLDKEERRVDRPTDTSYAILHSGNYEADETYAVQCSDAGQAGMKKCADFIAGTSTGHPIKTMTRLERGIYGLYMYWKCKVIIDQVNYTFATGSRYGNSIMSGNAVPGAHWDTTPTLNRFCSFSSYTVDGGGQYHDKLIRPREVIEYQAVPPMQPCSGVGCYRRQPKKI